MQCIIGYLFFHIAAYGLYALAVSLGSVFTVRGRGFRWSPVRVCSYTSPLSPGRRSHPWPGATDQINNHSFPQKIVQVARINSLINLQLALNFS